ncbi:hypothetical protein AMS68_002796 [Peltaster fructicola]|uniref:GET complex subunit GET2 n=1 Tax=Peltaster fructicola TaxID=286661 RepID=A0A6H0XRM5_9PEZI|nr:hypothetical protein AMS68_002796 [Peltaster fructicola]
MSTAMEGTEETPGQRAARLRREKRQDKAAAEERLARIKQLNGGVAPPTEVLGGPAVQSPSAADPDEVDITTQNYGGPRASDLNASMGSADNPMFQAMMQMQQEQARQGAGPRGPDQTQSGPGEQDPMTKMLQQMMGMAGGDPNDPNNIHNTEDPMQMLSTLLNGAKPQQSAPPPSTRSTYLWRLTHAIFAIIIAGYIAITSTFDGTLLSRTNSTFTDGSQDGFGSRLFLIFITAELGLQSARFFMEGGQLQGGGMLATVANLAPPPWGNYLSIAGRWFSIFASIISDAMIIVFVLGVMAWWNGASGVS